MPPRAKPDASRKTCLGVTHGRIAAVSYALSSRTSTTSTTSFARRSSWARRPARTRRASASLRLCTILNARKHARKHTAVVPRNTSDSARSSSEREPLSRRPGSIGSSAVPDTWMMAPSSTRVAMVISTSRLPLVARTTTSNSAGTTNRRTSVTRRRARSRNKRRAVTATRLARSTSRFMVGRLR